MKALLAALLFTFAAGAAAEGTYVRTVDLDAPGALEALAKSNPAHFDKLRRLVDRAMSRDQDSVERFIRTVGGKTTHRGNIIQTSYPAKAPLWFILDDTRYMVTVTLTSTPKRAR